MSELSKHLQLLYIASSPRIASHLYMYRITTLMKFIRHVLLLTLIPGNILLCVPTRRPLSPVGNPINFLYKSAGQVSGQVTTFFLTQDKQNQAFPENTAVRTEQGVYE